MTNFFKNKFPCKQNELIVDCGELMIELETGVICGMAVGGVFVTMGLVSSFLIRFVDKAGRK